MQGPVGRGSAALRSYSGTSCPNSPGRPGVVEGPVSHDDFNHAYRGSLVLLSLAAFVIVCAGVKLAAPILAPVVLGGYIAIVNVPLVTWLCRRRVPLGVTVSCALLADALMLGGFVWLLVGAMTRLSLRLPVYLSRLQLVEQQASEWIASFGVTSRLYELVDPAAVVGMLTVLAGQVATAVTDMVLALIVAAFLLFRFAKPDRDAAGSMLRTEGFQRAASEMYRYIAIKTVISMATGTAIGFWHWTIDADLPILFGLIAFLLNYIPTLGSIAAGVLATSVGVLQYGVEHAALVALGYVVVNVIFGEVIEPRVMGRALGLWPLVVLLSVVFWTWMLGIVGAVLSALLTQAVKLLLLAAPDFRAVGLALGPRSAGVPVRESQVDLLEAAMPKSVRPPAPGP